MNQEELKRVLTEVYADTGDVIDELVDYAVTALPEDVRCHTNQDEIIVYIEAELDGRNAAALFPQVDEQLTSCASCRVVYEEMKALLAMEQAGTLLDPPKAANLDLSFLPQPVSAEQEVGAVTVSAAGAGSTKAHGAQSIQWILNDVGQMIITLSSEFMAALQPSPQLAHLKAAADELFVVTSPPIIDTMIVTLTARTKRRNQEQCVVGVAVDIPDRGGWPNLGNTQVRLFIGGDTVAEQYTDAFGKVVFDEVAQADLGRIRVMVTPMQ